jgi:hypothetical protein
LAVAKRDDRLVAKGPSVGSAEAASMQQAAQSGAEDLERRVVHGHWVAGARLSLADSSKAVLCALIDTPSAVRVGISHDGDLYGATSA